MLKAIPNPLTNDLLVSVIIPSYNRPNETLRAVNSVLLQDYPFIEIIVIDDNGAYSDASLKTRETLKELISSGQINYIAHINNLGGNAARNTGLSAAKGQYIAFLDSDDEFLAFKISKQVELLRKVSHHSNKIKAVTCNMSKYINGKIVSTTSNATIIDSPYPILSLEISLGAGSTILFEKECLLKTGIFDESLLRHQEVEFILRFLKYYNIQILPEILVSLHIDDRSNIPTTKKFIDNKNNFFLKVSDSINALSIHEKKKIFMQHNLEISKVAIRNKNYLIAIKYFLKAKPSFNASQNFLRDVLGGIQTYLFKKHFNKKQ